MPRNIPWPSWWKKGKVDKNLARLRFRPAIYSPAYKLVDAREIRQARQGGMLVIPWTVNEPGDIRRMLELGVDAIISDYPERVLLALNRL
jgi:glycerophosphoryl diester phosphodiesterase